MTSEPEKPRVCPWWLGYLLVNPLRRLVQKPEPILSPYVQSGMTVLEIGPGMGYFSLPLARLVGPGGRVVCVDLQQKMLDSLRKRAAKAGLAERITPILASADSLCLGPFAGSMDFTLAFYVVHEVPDKARLFREIAEAMKPGGKLLLSEPKGHVAEEDFERTVKTAEEHGFRFDTSFNISRSRSVLLIR